MDERKQKKWQKNVNSISFTVLLLVLLMASTGIIETKAACFKFLGECRAVPFLGTNTGCTNCCVGKFGSAVCTGRVEVESGVNHCHCYGTWQKLTLLAPKCKLMLCAISFCS
ncbi:PREDICTED: defensin-like protein 208 [Camelina sativa]|uniref:Defensin-like protein 208 n=1 Tax=Camelina sativa TaxID=90675 RepID=A0ABM1QWF3_CAMSA|nr:PREDICTED: defensin-like protein 208 [Camelina sativa]